MGELTKPARMAYSMLITVIRLNIATSDQPISWGFEDLTTFHQGVDVFIEKYKKQIDEPIPYWIENA